jgi:hypothetical protein
MLCPPHEQQARQVVSKSMKHSRELKVIAFGLPTICIGSSVIAALYPVYRMGQLAELYGWPWRLTKELRGIATDSLILHGCAFMITAPGVLYYIYRSMIVIAKTATAQDDDAIDNPRSLACTGCPLVRQSKNVLNAMRFQWLRFWQSISHRYH